MGWERLTNGRLLEAAATAGFAVLITVDRNMSRQQSHASMPIAVVVLFTPANVIEALELLAPTILTFLQSPPEKRFYAIEPGGTVTPLTP